MALSPRVPTPMPATEPVMITREGSLSLALDWRRGVNLVVVSMCR